MLPPDSSKKARRPGQKWRCTTRPCCLFIVATVGAIVGVLWWFETLYLTEMLPLGDAQTKVRSVSEPHLPNRTLPYLLSLDPTARAKLLMNGRAYLLEGLLDGWQLHTTKSSFMKRYGDYPIHDPARPEK